MTHCCPANPVLRSFLIAGRATLTTVESRKTIVEPRIVATSVRRCCRDTHAILGTVNARSLRAWCLDRAGAVEEFPFGPRTSVFKVGGKMFALSALDSEPLTVSLKCEPELAAQLRATHPAIAPGYHLNKRHWNTV